MSLNKLYNFIHAVIFKNDKQKVDTATLFQQTHTNGTSYYRLELPKRRNNFPEELTLTEHHISVYEEPLNVVDKKSEYHYTATFMDQQKKSYRLHVYFNHLDELVSPPQLALETEDHQYKAINADVFDVDWVLLGQKEMASVIAHLREEQNKQCTSLKREMGPIEQRTTHLSENLAKNKKKYLTSLDQQIKLSLQLDAINSKEDKQKAIALMQTVYQDVKSRTFSPSVSSKKSKKITAPATQLTTTEESTKKEASAGTKAALSKKPIKSSTSIKDKEEQFALKIKKLSDELLQIGAITDESEKTSVLQVLFQQISELQLMVPAHLTKSVQMLTRMEQSVIATVKKHLHLLLSKNKFDEAIQLRALFPMVLDETVLNKALAELNADLLAFLLKNVKYDIEQFEPKAHKKNYDSIMEYLFQCDLKSSKVARCFEVLLNHKMSLLRSDSAGFPLLLPLIEDEDHPLTQILMKNLKNSSENLRLFKLVINYFEGQRKSFLPESLPYQRISNAIAVMKNLDEELRKELQLKKVPTRNNFLSELNVLSKLNSILEETQGTMCTLMTVFTTNILDLQEESEKLTSNSQQRDIYGGLGFFILPDSEFPNSPEGSHSDMMKKK